MIALQVSPKQQILGLVRQMAISEEQFNNFNEKIEQKLAQRDLRANDVSLQLELNRISDAYRRVITEHKANLKIQYDLGRDTLQQIENTDDLSEIMAILQVFQTAITPVLEKHRRLEMQVQDLEGKIISLLPKDTWLV